MRMETLIWIQTLSLEPQAGSLMFQFVQSQIQCSRILFLSKLSPFVVECGAVRTFPPHQYHQRSEAISELLKSVQASSPFQLDLHGPILVYLEGCLFKRLHP